jgi:nucleotidyltransferase substrate binding protein (TIGR01987 family)
MEDFRPDQLRWKYRFSHYTNAFKLLEAACDEYSRRDFSDLEKEGLVSRFAFTWELSWKLLKDYIDFLGVTLDTIGPRTVIRKAAEANIISKPERWMKSLDLRNNLAHVYSRQLRDDAVEQILAESIYDFKELYAIFEDYNNEFR